MNFDAAWLDRCLNGRRRQLEDCLGDLFAQHQSASNFYTMDEIDAVLTGCLLLMAAGFTVRVIVKTIKT